MPGREEAMEKTSQKHDNHVPVLMREKRRIKIIMIKYLIPNEKA